MILSKLVVTLLTATVTFSARSRRKQSEDDFIPLDSNSTMDGVLNYYSYTDDETFTMGNDIDPHADGSFVSASPIERRNPQLITINLQHYKTNRFEYDNVFVARINIHNTVFKVKVDTGSSDLWVAREPPENPDIRKTILQIPPKSGALYIKTYRPKYGVRGLLKVNSNDEKSRAYEGNVIFGGVTVIRHLYGALAGFTRDFDNQPYDGILGFAFPALSFNKGKSVIAELLGQHRLTRVFAFHIAETGSKLFIGWLGDPELFDESRLEYHPGVKAGAVGLKKAVLSYWAIDNGKVKVGEEVIAEKLRTLIISGTDTIFGPQEQVDKIYAKIETAVKRNGHWILRCNLHPFPKISFSWGGQDWTLTRDSFMLFGTIVNHGGTYSNQGHSDNEHVCLGAIQVMPEGEWPSGSWALGNSFMKNAHVVFNTENELRPKLGLAPFHETTQES